MPSIARLIKLADQTRMARWLFAKLPTGSAMILAVEVVKAAETIINHAKRFSNEL